MLLLEDPLAELTDLRDPTEFGLEAVGYLPVPPEVAERNVALRVAEEPVTARVQELADAKPVDDLVHAVFVAAARADRRLDQEALCAPMTRALTAGLFRQSHPPDDLSGTFRWTDTAAAVQDALNAELGGRCQRPRSCRGAPRGPGRGRIPGSCGRRLSGSPSC